MDKATLIERISAIEKEESFSFFEDGKQVESRFNIGTGYERYNEGSRGTGLSKALYAVVANLAIFRAQGKEKASVGLQAFDVFFGKLIGEVKETSIVSSLSEERKKAIRIFSSFLDGTERVTMADILARAFPLLAVKFALTEEGIDKKTDAVDHIHDPFDLARKIRMPGSVDDVDLVPLVVDAGRLGKDGDSSLVLERIGIHAAGGDLFVFAESPARLEHGIDKSGLAVIDVGDDGDVSDFVVHNEYLLHKKTQKIRRVLYKYVSYI